MKTLISFIKEARKKGYSDLQVRDILLKHNWPLAEIEKAFSSLQPKFNLKNQVCVFLNAEIINKLEKRAKRNMFTLPEQVEDILRRSCVSGKRVGEEKLDDTFIRFFSRRK